MSDVRQVIVMRKDLNMRKGKMIAQGSHASMMFLTKKFRLGVSLTEENPQIGAMVHLSTVEQQWLEGLFTKICLSVNSEAELRELIDKGRAANIVVHEVIDAGKTEFNGVPTLTCAAFGPDEKDVLQPITGHLPLL